MHMDMNIPFTIWSVWISAIFFLSLPDINECKANLEKKKKDSQQKPKLRLKKMVE